MKTIVVNDAQWQEMTTIKAELIAASMEEVVEELLKNYNKTVRKRR